MDALKLRHVTTRGNISCCIDFRSSKKSRRITSPHLTKLPLNLHPAYEAGYWATKPYGHINILDYVFPTDDTKLKLNLMEKFMIGYLTRAEWRINYVLCDCDTIFFSASRIVCGVTAGVFSDMLSVAESYDRFQDTPMYSKWRYWRYWRSVDD